MLSRWGREETEVRGETRHAEFRCLLCIKSKSQIIYVNDGSSSTSLSFFVSLLGLLRLPLHEW